MNKLIYFIMPLCIALFSCNTESEKQSIEKWKQEILETEQSFAKMAREQGTRQAFLFYAAEDAVLMRNNDLVVGKKDIDLLYKHQTSKDLSWKLDFADVSASGDLGYTYDHYTFSYVDSSDSAIENKCIFHTVWKRQTDGTWRFVWD